MPTLGSRTTGTSRATHVADHNALHAIYDALDGNIPSYNTSAPGLPTTTGRHEGDHHFDETAQHDYVLSNGSWVDTLGAVTGASAPTSRLVVSRGWGYTLPVTGDLYLPLDFTGSTPSFNTGSDITIEAASVGGYDASAFTVHADGNYAFGAQVQFNNSGPSDTLAVPHLRIFTNNFNAPNIEGPTLQRNAFGSLQGTATATTYLETDDYVVPMVHVYTTAADTVASITFFMTRVS